MILFVGGATKTVEKFKEHPNLGQFLQPDNRNSVEKIITNGMPWACDNGCFTGFDEIKYLKMVKKVDGMPRLKFVTMPDVVCDSKETHELFKLWYPVFERYYNVPLAYVIQNDVCIEQIPWYSIAAIFLGGDTNYKLGAAAAQVIRIAKSKDKWVHMGRVNSLKRIHYARLIGCDSVDGSGFSMFPDAMIPDALRFLESEQIGFKECFV